MAQVVKNLAANAGDPGLIPCLEKGMATHSSILAWRIPWTEEPGRLQSTGHKELDTTEKLSYSLSSLYSLNEPTSNRPDPWPLMAEQLTA